MEKKLIKIEIKNRWTGKVLFEYEKEDNTIKETVVEAVKNGADLGGAYLVGAYLGGTDIRGANLGGTDLRGAYLGGANLLGANLRGAYLVGANLGDADLRGANLRGANLLGANLLGANLGCANLGDADLRGANLRGAYLVGAKNVPFIPMSCPSDGAFVGWKKVKDVDEQRRCLVKLEIQQDSKRSSSSGTKCRCDYAKVLDIIDIETGEHLKSCINTNYVQTAYYVGEIVKADSFDEDRWNECSHGIHFFINRQEVEEYDI